MSLLADKILSIIISECKAGREMDSLNVNHASFKACIKEISSYTEPISYTDNSFKIWGVTIRVSTEGVSLL